MFDNLPQVVYLFLLLNGQFRNKLQVFAHALLQVLNQSSGRALKQRILNNNQLKYNQRIFLERMISRLNPIWSSKQLIKNERPNLENVKVLLPANCAYKTRKINLKKCCFALRKTRKRKKTSYETNLQIISRKQRKLSCWSPLQVEKQRGSRYRTEASGGAGEPLYNPYMTSDHCSKLQDR